MTNDLVFQLGNEKINRLGFGAMRITGPGIWGYPADRAEALSVLRRARELGVDFIDTADSYGPSVSEELIFEALHPYGDVKIATKAGLLRTGPDVWVPCGVPDYLRQECELSLRRLGQESLDLFQLHRIDPKVPADEQFGVLKDLLDEGKVKTLGLSEVTVDEIKAAQKVFPVATVQNLYNLTNRQSEDVLDYCDAQGIGFIPWFPVASGSLARPGGPLDALAKEKGVSVAQLSLAWLLLRSTLMIPIPGTSKVAHLEENVAAKDVELDDDTFKQLSELTN
ncbi:MAG TPA: aldo/keto reductase [Acidimicrobiales bacterium]|jgi:aryl-alcohol dehydrogenase-like predicted oxidoreductase|nr:aldo/keto reductase [Acidimicrobiales bacterium]